MGSGAKRAREGWPATKMACCAAWRWPQNAKWNGWPLTHSKQGRPQDGSRHVGAPLFTRRATSALRQRWLQKSNVRVGFREQPSARQAWASGLEAT